jgi:hypothetical protein
LRKRLAAAGLKARNVAFFGPAMARFLPAQMRAWAGWMPEKPAMSAQKTIHSRECE